MAQGAHCKYRNKECVGVEDRKICASYFLELLLQVGLLLLRAHEGAHKVLACLLYGVRKLLVAHVA